MTKEQKIEAYAMRLDGAPIRKIAEKYGVSFQYIQQLFPGTRKDTTKKYGSYIYPNIVRFLVENNMPVHELAELCDISYGRLQRFLSGKHGGSKWIIDKILPATGTTYEEAFAKGAPDES